MKETIYRPGPQGSVPQPNPLTILECIALAKEQRDLKLYENTLRRACASKHIQARKFGSTWAVNEESFLLWLEDYPHTGKFWKERRRQKRLALKKKELRDLPY